MLKCLFRLLLCLLVGIAAANGLLDNATAAPSPAPWRCVQNGGINVLYCYLGVIGKSCSYEQLVAEQNQITRTHSHDAKMLCLMAAKHGVQLRTVRLSIKDLDSVSMPVIVHVDGDTPDAGAFLLLLSVNNGLVYFMNGPSATFQSIDLEDFRRIWDGYALSPTFWSANSVTLAAVIIAVCILTGLLVRRGTKETKNFAK